jgi:hypothetical protein
LIPWTNYTHNPNNNQQLPNVASCINQLHIVLMESDILRDAHAAPSKQTLQSQREPIALLRAKGYTWRQIAAFLNERGIQTDHTAVYRLLKGRAGVAGPSPHAAYEQVRALLDTVGGEMVWQPGGVNGGGDWELTLHGKKRRVPVRNNEVNALDELCIAKTRTPHSWNDYDTPAPLKPDAFWRLITLFK